MKTFKFGQLLPRGDICDREGEIRLLKKLSVPGGRAVVYGPRRYGKTSVVKNAIMADFLELKKKSLAVYADLFQVDSLADAAMRLQVAFEEALNRKAKIRSFIGSVQNYLKHFRVELTADPLSGAPAVTLSGAHVKDERTLAEIFAGIRNFSQEYESLLVLDEFQDIRRVPTLEAKLRAEIQALDRMAVIVLGSRKHVLRELFSSESSPFYGFGTDVEFGKIPEGKWFPYMKERFLGYGLDIEEDGVAEICGLMNGVPNAIQELCQWITLSGQAGRVDAGRIHAELADLIEKKSSRYMERLAALSAKEKKVLMAVARMEPVSSIASTKFLRASGVSATATRATIARLSDYGMLEQSEEGSSVTDPLFKLFLLRKLAVGQ